jgi:hypothetical protein
MTGAMLLLMELGMQSAGQVPPPLPPIPQSAPRPVVPLAPLMPLPEPTPPPAPLPNPNPQSGFAAASRHVAPTAPTVATTQAVQETQPIAAPPTVQGPPPNPLPDPTNPSGPFKELLNPKTAGPAPTGRSSTFVIRGRVLAAGKEPTAMLEVDGKLALVTAGSVLAYGGSTVRVVEITSQEVRLEIGSSGEKLSLR